ncbi:hypothetical protein C1645_880917 [Glomus cerebriforme]|uniref:Uncharacterized protein n=1 Tax=Glomus cerebriforme TaxID=658196 RepID=A0A397SJH3_9GLOM|nr:hypothetical protein C1645_880917 [Glomus cerebriforme]
MPSMIQGKQDQSLPSCVSDQKSLVDREIDTFLDDAHKKSVSDGIRRYNKKKLLRETASLKVLPSAENNPTVSLGNDQSHVPLKTTNGDASSKLKQCEENGPITFEAKPDPELIIKSVLEHFTYLKFRNSFRGIDNYNFASPQPWSSPCPICDGKHGNYGLHGSWYCENGNQFPYDPELAKLYFQDKLEYCLTCNTSSNKLKFAIVA